MMIWFFSCTPSTMMDTGSAEDSAVIEDTYVIDAADCPLQATPTTLSFSQAPAMSLPQRMTITLSQDCADSHVLLSTPQDWTDDTHFSVTIPSNTQAHDQSTLEVVFTPSWEQEHASELNVPYTHIESPLNIFLEASVSAPLPLLIIGGQLRRILSLDYGQSIVSETQNAGVQKGVCYGDGGYLIVGGMDQGVIWRSQTGENWQQYTLDTESIDACAYGNNRYVMYADGLFSSIAGVEWEEGSDTPWMEEGIQDITFGGGVFVAVGDQGRIATTTHGAYWDRDALQGNFQLKSVAFGNDLFVAVGNLGAILWSDDLGESWTTERVGSGIFQRVIFGNGFFFTSDGSDLYRSSDGIIWTSINTDGVQPLASYGTLLVGLRGQQLYHSTDLGVSWSPQSQLSLNAPIFDAVIAQP